MSTLIDFFTLRPVFTAFGLKVVWYLYLTNIVVQVYTSLFGISRVLAQRGISMEAWLPNAIPLALSLASQLIIVRLLLEIANIIIASWRRD
jgi:hypothetical protein